MKIQILPLILVPLLMASARAQTPLPNMQVHQQSLDGNPSDVVGPSDVTTANPDNERVWGLQGRRREAWQVSTRERQLDEEDFDFATELKAAAIDQESPQALEHRLFTLTARRVQETEMGTTTFPAVIRVDRINNPSAPVRLLPDFSFPAADQPVFICTIPGQRKLIVLMAPHQDVLAELRIYNYDNLPLTLDADPMGVAQIPTGDTGCTQPKTFRSFLSAQVELIQVPGVGDKRMALVNATLANPPIEEVCFPPSPQPSGLLICNVDDPVHPFFYAENLTKQAWDPCRSSGNPCSDWRIGGFAHVRTTGMAPRDLVYAVGGKKIELTELDVTHVADPQIGIDEVATYSLKDTPTDPYDDLFDVFADPEAPATSDYLYVVGRNKAYAVNRASLSTGILFTRSLAGFGNGPAGGGQFVLEGPLTPPGTGPDRPHTWTLAQQQARYVFRVTEFTQDGGPLNPPDISEEYYSAGPTDGAVANFNWASAYTLTFGGVVRWDISGEQPVPVIGSYQPALDAGKDYTTEHLELVDLGQVGTPDWHLIAATPHGGFFEWPLDPITHDPLAGSFYAPQNPETYWPGLHWHDNAYGNDIAITTDTSSNKWIIVDYSSKSHKFIESGPVVPQFGIARYNWTQPFWDSAELGASTFWPFPSSSRRRVPRPATA